MMRRLLKCAACVFVGAATPVTVLADAPNLEVAFVDCSLTPLTALFLFEVTNKTGRPIDAIELHPHKPLGGQILWGRAPEGWVARKWGEGQIFRSEQGGIPVSATQCDFVIEVYGAECSCCYEISAFNGTAPPVWNDLMCFGHGIPDDVPPDLWHPITDRRDP